MTFATSTDHLGQAPSRDGVSATSYLRMAECGLIAPDDRTELLEGVIVSMPPATPLHDNSVHRVQYALLRALGLDACIRVQSAMVTGSRSVPVPDVAVVPGSSNDYDRAHPTRAHLVVEVAQSSLPQDRLTKAALYARAGITDYWIVNLREGVVEAYGNVDREAGLYRSIARASGNDLLTLEAFPGIGIRAGDLLPPEDDSTPA